MYAYQIVFYRSGVEVVKVSKEARKQHFLRSFKVWRRKKPKKSSVSFSFVLITFCHNKKSRHSLLYFSRPIIKILFHSKRDLHFFLGGGGTKCPVIVPPKQCDQIGSLCLQFGSLTTMKLCPIAYIILTK